MSRRRLGRGRRQGRAYQATTYYGIDSETGVVIEPVAAFQAIDDVTDSPIPAHAIGFQDGLIKDTRPRAGSWEKEWRHMRAALEIVTYDPALGVQQRPAGGEW